MRRLTLALTALLVLPTAPALAQNDGASLPEHLQEFSVMLGHWKGTGSVEMPGMPAPMEWTSQTTVRPALGNQVIQAEMRIDLKGPMPMTMVYRSYYGYDAKNSRLVSYTIGNTGELEVSTDVRWVEGKTLVVSGTRVEGGQPQVHRSVTSFDGDTSTLRWEVATGDGPMTTIVSGNDTRSEEGFSISKEQWANAMMAGMPAPPEMQKVAGMAGEYTMSGEYKMVPGMPATPFSGRESVRSIFGGNGLIMEVVGDPMPGAGDFRYEAIGFIGYVPREKVYRQFYVSNMGEVGHDDLHFVDDKTIVHVSTSVENGTPVVQRSVVQLGDDGRLVRSTVDQMRGTADADRVFVGEYARRAD